LLLAVLAAQPLVAGEIVLKVAAGKSNRIETPVCAEIALPADLANVPPGELTVQLEGPGGKTPGQVVPAAEKGKAVLWWIVSLKAGQKAAYRATIARGKPTGTLFTFQDQRGQHLDLLFGGRRVTRLMYAYDTSTRQRRFQTYKVFLHVFDSRGEREITNDWRPQFPHHRGIFIGWNGTRLPDGRGYDFWHMGRGVTQRLERFAAQQAGPVAGRMVALIRWADPKGEAVIMEEREITVYRQSKPEILLDFVSTLRSQVGGAIKLEGDPEHAGCQFRAHSDVSKSYQRETRYLLRPGMREGTRGTRDMPWAVMSFRLGESRFNVAHLNHPANPKGTVYSANRRYGRFGAFPKSVVKADEPLVLRYRFYVREGQEPLTVEAAQRLHDDFATPPRVTVKK